MLAQATTADTTILAAFAVGFVSFISPCVLPLVPGYLSAVSGVSISDLRERDHPLTRVLGPAIVFCLSFTVMFVALGMTATGLGQALNDHRATLDKVDSLKSASAKRRHLEAALKTLREDGWAKVESGLTTADEVIRVTQEF